MVVQLAESDLQVKSKTWCHLPSLFRPPPVPAGTFPGLSQCLTPLGRTHRSIHPWEPAHSWADSREPCARGSLCLFGGTAPGFFLLPKPPLCTMGLSSSKAHPKVTRVAPMLSSEDLPAHPIPHPGVLGGPILHPRAVGEWGTPKFHGQLPPLRNTSYGRASAGKGQGGVVLGLSQSNPITCTTGLVNTTLIRARFWVRCSAG